VYVGDTVRSRLPVYYFMFITSPFNHVPDLKEDFVLVALPSFPDHSCCDYGLGVG